MMTKRCRCALLAGLLALASGLAACSTNPATGEQNFTLMSPSDELQIGRQEHPKVLEEFGVYDEMPGLSGYVAVLGGRLHAVSELSQQPFTFTLLDSDMVNAFAIPGGYVYVTRGLMALANSEAELAGVIGHEIGHVTARHSAQRATQQTLAGLGAVALGAVLGDPAQANMAGLGAMAWVQGYSREHELEADQLGIRYMSRAGYDPAAMSSFLSSLGRESELQRTLLFQDGEAQFDWFSTHPRTPDRVAAAVQAVQGSGSVNWVVGRDEYLRRLDGMIFGDSPEQGFVRGRTFAHPIMRMTFDVPEGFRMLNSPNAVLALNKDGAFVRFDGVDAPAGQPMTTYLVQGWAKGRQLNDIERIDMDGLEAATGALRLQGSSGPIDVHLVAIRWDPQTVYRFMIVSPAQFSQALDLPMRRMLGTFRRLSPAEAAALKPLRLHIVEVGAGDTVASLAGRMAFPDYQRERFMVLNGITSDNQLRPGMLVKIVTEG
jgi:predicted Zn-dependent protease